ncbi:MAG: hypothetical protein LBH43_14560 [Treponema sp.]|jgi:hypothetical protein|nr:hypothetical protein [Treponema sp.]
MSFRKDVLVALVVIAVITIMFSGCLLRPAQLEQDPNSSVDLGTRHVNGTNDQLTWIFNRDSSGPVSQFYFEITYLGSQAPNISTLLLKIDSGEAISLKGDTPSRRPAPLTGRIYEDVRFVISDGIANRLLNCNSFTLQAVGQNIHREQQAPHDIYYGSLYIHKLKEFLSHWNG